MVQWREDAKEFARQLRFAAECVEYYCKVSAYKDCNDCKKDDCEYRPSIGDMVRINCPLWQGLEGNEPE